jgi:3-oxoacyl-[acyl-carrier protein] reductase
MTPPLASKRALITGGSKGIGRAIAIAFAEAGADVAICHWGDTSNAASLADEIARRSRRTIALEADVSDEPSVLRLMHEATQFLGGLDILVNNAGIMIDAPLLETSATDFDRVIAVNLRGPFLVGREAIRQMVAQRSGGRVINIASELGYLGRAGASAYCAAKGGVLTLTRTWAREFAPDILVNAIAPGPVDTDLLGWNAMSTSQRAMETALPLGRIGRPEEIAPVAVFLAGPGATYVTGQCYGVNGGAVMV